MEDKSKITIFSTASDLEKDTGQSLRLRSLVKYFLKHNYEVSIVNICFYVPKEATREFLKQPVTYLPIKFIDLFFILRALVSGYPLSVAIYQRYSSRRYTQKRLYHLVRSVQINSLKDGDYIDFCESLYRNMLLRSRLPENQYFKRLLFKLEALLLRKLELKLLHRNGLDIQNFAIARDDYLENGNNNLIVLPNEPRLERNTSKLLHDKQYDVVFIGDIEYDPNWESLLILKSISLEIPIRVAIIGRTKRKKRHLMESLGWDVFGYLDKPEDIIEKSVYGWAYMNTATGMQNKVLDYDQSGAIPICSPRVARGFLDMEIYHKLEIIEDIAGVESLLAKE